MTNKITNYLHQFTKNPPMPPSGELDDSSLAVVQSLEFQHDAIGFLRKEKRFGDTAIRIASDELLRDLARRFCRVHLDKLFPNIRQTGVPEHHLIYKEVFKIYRGLKTELLDKVKLKRPLPIICASEPIMPSELRRPASPSSEITLDSSTTTTTRSSHSTRRRRPRERRRKRGRLENQPAENNSKILPVAISDDESRVAKTAAPAKAQIWTGGLILSERCPDDNRETFKPLGTPEMAQDASRAHSDQEALVEDLLKQCQELRDVNRRLEQENQTLTKHQKFVHCSLRLCQDTWLAEAEGFEAAKLERNARECKRVVGAFRDVLSDLDFEYFRDYYRLEKRAPPSRWWLDGIASQK